MPSTAHILGGAVIAGDPSHGVIDAHGQVFGYQNLLITDGSALPANPGVNPSLTITALAEHTIAQVPATRAAGPGAPRRQVSARQRTPISSARANGETNSRRSPLQKRPGSYQLAGRRLGSRPMCW